MKSKFIRLAFYLTVGHLISRTVKSYVPDVGPLMWFALAFLGCVIVGVLLSYGFRRRDE